MKETLIFDELMGCAGMPAKGSCTELRLGLFPSTKGMLLLLLLLVLFWPDGHALLLEPSRRVRDGDW